MGRTTVVQLVGAILSGLNVAIPLVLNARSILPEWNWEYHALLGFIAFVGVMVWIINDKQRKINKFEQRRPELTLGGRTGAIARFIEQTSEMHIALQLYFKNQGSKAAYQFRLRVGFAPDGAPSQFKPLDERTSANRIDPGSMEYGYTYDLVTKYEEKNGKKVIARIGTLIHCALNYSDSPSGGKSYDDEWWFSYRTDRQGLGALSSKRKEELEPYVKLAYQQKAPS